MDNVSLADKVLIVDDDLHNVRILSSFLKAQGFEVIPAYDWETALAQAGALTPECVLLDVVMPVVDGFEICRRLKQDPLTQDIPVIFTTVLTSVSEKVEGFEAGGVDYITKPFQSKEVIARVKTHVSLRKLQRELTQKNQLLEKEIKERTKIEKTLRETADRLKQQVSLDPLTGIYNRGHFFELASRELARSRRYGNPMSLLMFDIDNFKRINDEYGHLVGDQVIKDLAMLFHESLRKSDVLARYGGEEYVALLPETNYENAKLAGERLRSILEQTPIVTEKGEIHVTASFGGVVVLTREDMHLDELLDRADQALYKSKADGRNRVTMWRELKQ